MEEVWSGSRGETSDGFSMKQIWKNIWSMKTPNKIKNFAWRACRDMLVKKVNLKKKHITQDDTCNDCGKEVGPAQRI